MYNECNHSNYNGFYFPNLPLISYEPGPGLLFKGLAKSNL